jgi:hypothetical protein
MPLGVRPCFPVHYLFFVWANAAVLVLSVREAQHEFINNFLGWRPFTIRSALTFFAALADVLVRPASLSSRRVMGPQRGPEGTGQ